MKTFKVELNFATKIPEILTDGVNADAINRDLDFIRRVFAAYGKE